MTEAYSMRTIFPHSLPPSRTSISVLISPLEGGVTFSDGPCGVGRVRAVRASSTSERSTIDRLHFCLRAVLSMTERVLSGMRTEMRVVSSMPKCITMYSFVNRGVR